MGMNFGDSAGGAKKNNLDYVKFGEGTNRIRFVGEILPRYCYWKQLKTNNIPVECLSFSREKEMFTNTEKDWFKHYFPKREDGKDVYPVWSYAIQAIDLNDGKLKMCGLKKKLFEQILKLSQKPAFGDPTDVNTGWDIVFEKTKTGPHAFNVEYNLDQLECKVRALTDEEKETIKDIKPIDELIPRPSAEDQKAFIETAWFGEEEANTDDDAAKAAAGERSDADKFDDDIPF